MISETLHVMVLHYRNKGRAIEPTLPEQKRPHEHTAQLTFRSASLEVGNTQDDPISRHIFVNIQTRRQLMDIDPVTGLPLLRAKVTTNSSCWTCTRCGLRSTMFWFRYRQPTFIRLAIVLWVLAFGLSASQGCLAQPIHNPATTHASLNTTQDHNGQNDRSLGCLQHCADAAIAVSPSLHLQMFDLSSWTFLLLIPALLILYPSPLRFCFSCITAPCASQTACPPDFRPFQRLNRLYVR